MNSEKYKARLLQHYRDLIYYEEWFWNCKHRCYTDKEVLVWAVKMNKGEGETNNLYCPLCGENIEFFSDEHPACPGCGHALEDWMFEMGNRG